jgi:hypothetical protein
VSASPQDSPRGHPRVPRTPQQQADLLLSRPAGWEYLLAAGVFAQGFDALEMKSLDHEMQIPRRGPRARVEIVDGMKYLRAAFDDLGACIRHITRVFEPEAQEKAFGAPGEPGDPVRIQHFARHVLRCYEDMLDWAASVRNHAVPDRLVHVFEVTSMMVDEPLGETRDFMREFVDTMERLVVYLEDPSSGEPITITIALVLTISDDVKAEFDNEMATLRREYGSSPS